MLKKGSSIFLYAHSQFRGVYMGIIQQLCDEYDASIHLYTASKQESAFYWRTYPGLFTSITEALVLYSACREEIDDELLVIEEAHRNEAELGLTINKLAVNDRHLGRGYSLGGYKHPRSRISEETSYIQMVNGFNKVLDFWRRQIEEKKPDLLLNVPKVLCEIARQRNIPVRVLVGSRYKNYHQWVHSEFFDNPRVRPAFDGIKVAQEVSLAAPYNSHMSLRTKFFEDVSLRGVLKLSSNILMRHAYWRLRGYAKAKGYFPFEEVAFVRRRRQDTKDLLKLSRPLKDLKGQKFIFYPLHTEPEIALQTLSPEYFYQLSCITALSRDLPAGVKLAVKETYEAVGRRPTDFYRQIAEFKNVVMLDMMELGLDVVRQAEAVVTITGTAGFEAAVLGKPVIAFGRHNQYNFLDHVFVVTDEADLESYLKAALSDDFDGQKAAKDGARYLAATLSISFDLQEFDPLHAANAQEAIIGDATDSLSESLLEPAEFSDEVGQSKVTGTHD